MSNFNVILYDTTAKSAQTGGLELLDEWQVLSGSWVWVDISGAPDEVENKLLTERFGVPKLAIQDAHRDRHPPKMEIIDQMVFVIMRDLLGTSESHEPLVAQLSMFMGEKFLLTRHRDTVPAVESVFQTVQQQSNTLDPGPAHVTYRLIRRIIDNYTPVVLEFEERLADLEDEVFERPSDDVIETLTRYNRSLKRLRRHLAYQRDVAAQLHRPSSTMPVKLNRHEFNDAFENLERLASLCQLNQELAVDLLNTHLSLLSHRLNQVMRVLTITTVIFLPLALLAGVYGMNFQFMPELSWHYGYFGVLTAMVAIATGLAVIFKRKGWL